MTTPAPRLARHVSEQIRTQLEELAQRYHDAGRSLEELGSAEQLAGRMLAAVPEPSPWDSLLGPFYTASGVARLLGGVSRQAIADRRRRNTLLGLQTTGGTWLYPAVQFDGRGYVVEGLAAMLKVFADAPVDGWTVAGWLAATHEALSHRSVFEWLHAGRDPQVVLTLARDQAGRYRR